MEIILLGKKHDQNIYIANLNYLTPPSINTVQPHQTKGDKSFVTQTKNVHSILKIILKFRIDAKSFI